MFSNQEQISNATRSHVESQLALFASLSRHTFDSVEKFLDLNLNAARATMQESEAAARQLLTAKDAKEFFALSTAQRQPAVDKAISYGRHFAGIANSTRAGYSHLAETRVAEFNRRLVDMVENAAKNAPAGSENVVKMVKGAIDNASAGYERMTRSAVKAAEVMESNVSTATAQFAEVVEKAGSAHEKVVNAKK